MKLLFICGSRNWSKPEVIAREIQRVQPDFVLNGAGGDADAYSSSEAYKQGIHAIEVAAIWDVGRRAGPIRNAMMAEILRALKPVWEIEALAFSDNIHESRGTSDMVERLRKIGIVTQVVTE